MCLGLLNKHLSDTQLKCLGLGICLGITFYTVYFKAMNIYEVDNEMCPPVSHTSEYVIRSSATSDIF